MKHLLSLLLIFGAIQLSAQDIDIDKLRSISNEMYSSGNPKYVFVDALADGYIEVKDGILAASGYEQPAIDVIPLEAIKAGYRKPEGGYRFDLSYSVYGGHLEGVSKAMPEDVQTKYSVKFNRFLQSIGEEKSNRIEVHIWAPVSMEDIYDPASAFRSISKPELHNYRIDFQNLKAIYTAMANDGLIDPKESFKIVYNNDGIELNGKKLKGDVARKYAALYKEHWGVDPEDKTRKLVFRIEADNVQKWVE